MLDQYIESVSAKRKNRRWGYFIATATIWLVVMTSVIVAGIFAYDARLGAQYEAVTMLVPRTPAPNRGVKATSENRPKVDRAQQVTRYESVKEISEDIKKTASPPPLVQHVGTPSDGSDSGGPEIGVGNGGPYDGRVIGSKEDPIFINKNEEPPPPVADTGKPDPPVTNAPVRSTILQGSAIRRIEPIYPQMAKIASIRGTVIVEILVSEEGEVISARALSGHPLLREVSLKAARGWKWNPTRLNNVPVKVVGTITFNFQL